MQTIKEAIKEMADCLPDNCNWDDAIYSLYVRSKIGQGIKAADEGRFMSHEEAKKRIMAKFSKPST